MRGRLFRSSFLAAAVCAGLLLTALPATAQPGNEPAGIVAARVVRRAVPPERSFSGTSEGARRSVIGSAVDGRVQEVFAREGDEVQVGTDGELPRLAVLKTDTITQEIESAQAELKYRRQLHDELSSSLPEELNQFRAELDSAIESVSLAQKKYDITASLFQRQQATSREAFDEATSNLEVAMQQQNAAQAALRRLEAVGQIRVAQAESRVTAQVAELQKLEDQLGKHTLRAPFDGVVVLQLAEVGDWLARGQAMAEVVELDPLQIRIFVPEEFIPGLQAHMNITGSAEVLVRFDSIPDRLFSGEVHRIVLQADARSRSFPVLVRLPNQPLPDGRRLGAGMLARVMLPVGDPQEQLLVPKDSIRLGGAQPAVIVAAESEQGTVARLVPVELGIGSGPYVAVRGELTTDDLVVTEGHERLRPGQPLKIASIRDFEPVVTSDDGAERTTPAAAAGAAPVDSAAVER